MFVQIASYRDPECQWTVKDLFEKAGHPERVTVGICAQCDPGLDKDCFTVPSPRPAQTKVINVRPHESEGVCWARAMTQTLFEDQDYVLMIDSHMRFIPNWDTELIAELARCASPKAFLSTYPPGYKPPNDLEKNPKPIVMRAKPFADNGDIRFEGEVLSRTPERPLRGAFLAAGLLFAPGKFVREVPYDRRIYFNQEEITLATRAFTHGWDVYSPTKSFVYHYYNEPKRGEVRPLHWHDNKDWTRLQTLSIQRARYLLAGEEPFDPAALEDIGRFGLGQERSLAEYESFAGLDFANQVSTERAMRSQFIEGLDEYRKPPDPPPNAVRPLKAGEVLLPVDLKDAGGNKRSTGDFSGAPCLVCVLPYNFDSYTQGFLAKYRAKSAVIGVPVVFVAPVPSGEAAVFASRSGLPPEMLVDEEHLIGRLFGYSGRLHDTPLTVALDKAQVVRGIYDNRNSDNHLGDVLRAAEMLKAAS